MFKELTDKQFLLVSLAIEKYKQYGAYTKSVSKEIGTIQDLLHEEVKSRKLHCY